MPGPFRPITINKNQLQIYDGETDQTDDEGEPQEYMQRQSHSIQAFRELQSKPIQYTSHLNSKQQYMQVLPATTESMIKSDQHNQLKQYYEFPILHGNIVKSHEYATHGSVDVLKTNGGNNAEFNNHK